MNQTRERAGTPAMLHVRPRYYRWAVDPGVEWTEANTRHHHLDWTMPVSQCALVLIDVWNNHYLKETKERSERIVQERIRPLVDECREHGVAVIHAPSPKQAQEYPQWVGRNQNERGTESAEEGNREAEWPPREFRLRRGEYAAYDRPKEPRAPELAALRANLTVHPDVQPRNDDLVVATGDELDRVCRERELLFLFFAGFNTNACVLERDYSLRAMAQKGYATCIVRDCTTAMESYRSVSTLGQTEAAIEKIEMFLGYSVTSDDMIGGLQR